MLSPCIRQVAHALLTSPPLTYSQHSNYSFVTWVLKTRPFDLHVLSTPPALVLSQDQTLMLFIYHPNTFECIRFQSLNSISFLTLIVLVYFSFISINLTIYILLYLFSSSLRRLPYITIPFVYCQHFFCIFFAFFILFSSLFYYLPLLLSVCLYEYQKNKKITC